LCILELSRLTRIEKSSQKHNYISSDQGIQPEDSLTRRGRNM